jgi:hypothetical protein
MARLHRPLNGIPPEMMAVQHITEADFDEKTPVSTPDRLHRVVWGGATPDILVAHNCAFERQFVTEAVTDKLSLDLHPKSRASHLTRRAKWQCYRGSPLNYPLIFHWHIRLSGRHHFPEPRL